MRGRRGPVLALAAAAAVAGVCAASADASDSFWNNPLGGSFQLDANWSPGVPGALDNAVFDLSSPLPYVVSISSDVSNNQLRVGNDQLQLAFTPGVTYSLTSTSAFAPAVVIGDLPGDNGQLTLLDATIAAAGQVIVGSDGNGTLIIPAASRLSGGDTSIGFVGNGTLLLQNGGRFTTASASMGSNFSATGVALVDGINSNWSNSGNLYVGDFGSGDLTVSNNALVHSGGIYSGYAGAGSITVDSGGSLQSDSFIRIGDTATGDGSLKLTGGGIAQSVNGSIAFAGGSGSVLVDGFNSRWIVSGTLDAGLGGIGTMTIQNQGSILAGVVNIGSDFDGDGTVNVSGANSVLAAGGLLTVGGNGKGSLLVTGGGTVSSGGGVIGASSAGPNVVSVGGSNSSWNMGNNQLIVGDDGSGTLEISGSATVSNGVAIIARGAGSDGTVVLDDPNTQWISGGLVAVGLNGSGLLQVSGGALVSGSSAVVGGNALGAANGTGSVLLSGTNSVWNLTSSLTIGGGGIGSVSIAGGAKLFDASAIVGDGAGSTGIVNVQDAASQWNTSGTARIGNNGTGDVTIKGGATASSSALDLGANAPGNLAISGAGSSWSTTGTMRVGIAHFGTLTIDTGGSLISGSATVGSALGGIGQVVLSDGGSIWSNPGTLNVGRGGGDGVVSVQNGAALTSGAANIGGDGTSLSGNGAVLVKGVGSHWTAGPVVLGLGGSGDIEATLGGVIDAASVIASNGPASSLGSVKVADAGSRLNVSGVIEVAHDVSGTLDVSNGGVVSSGSGVIGTLPSATGTASVAGSGSKWNVGGNLDVAINGAGSLSIGNGGVVTATTASVGRGALGTGTVAISDAGSQFTLGDSLYIGGDSTGPQGNGMVSIAGSATVSATNQIKVWASGTLDLNNANVSTALVDLQGGLISGNGALASPVSSTNGRISTGSAITLSAPLSIVSGSNLTKQGTGTLTISGPQNHGAGATLNVAGGTVVINSDAGTAASAASAAAANLTVRVSGSRVTLGSDQELSGLDVQFANAGSQSFDLATPGAPGAFRAVRVYAADLAGAKNSIYAAMRNANAAGAPDPTDGIFDSGLLAHPGSKLGIARLNDLHGDPYILIRPTRVGDLNLDGSVTISDFIDLASNFNGVNKTWQEGDLNYDGQVTISDFIDLASNFNAGYSGEALPISPQDQQTLAMFASSIGLAVPEPASMTLILGMTTALLATRRRRR